jgi:hypothetical protein
MLRRAYIIEEVKDRLESETTGLNRTFRDWTYKSKAGKARMVAKGKYYKGIVYPPTSMPQAYIMTDQSDVEKQGDLPEYNKTLPIEIEIYEKKIVEDLQEVGEIILEMAQRAIEQDERFKRSINGTTYDLVKSFSLTGENVFILKPSLVWVYLSYEFYYVEKFLGKRTT